MSTLPLLTALLLTLLSLQTQAATLLIDDTGLLTGATDVIVSNAVYRCVGYGRHLPRFI
mgnify:CR=1 FL=1